MAVFNPQIQPEQDPSYLNLSRPITQPEGNKAAEYGLKGATTLLEHGVKATDTYIKDTIDKALYSEIDSERDAYTQALEDTTIPVNARPTQGQMDLIPSSKEGDTLPQDLETLPKTLGSLEGARANGKLSNTYYIGRLNTIAKDMRSRYPGYREYIDKQIHEVTGMNPANALVTSLVGDVNAALTAAKSERDKTLAMIDKYIGNPGAPLIRQQFLAGNIDDQRVREWVHQREVWDDFYKFNNLQHQYNQNNRAEAEVSARRLINDKANTDVTAHLDTMTVVLQGQNVNLVDYINNKPVSADDARVIALELNKQRETMRQRLTAEFNRPQANGRRLVDDVGGPEKMRNIIDENLKAFDNFSTLMTNGEYGAAYQSVQRAKGIINDQTLKALQDPKIGPPLVMLDILKQRAGEPFVAQYYKTLLTNGFSQNFKNYSEALTLPLMTQPGVNTRTGTGTVVTGNDQLTKADGAGVATPEITKEIVDRLASIADPATPEAVRISLAQAAFTPGNQGFISRFSEDRVEVVDGRRRYTPGKMHIFQQLTSPAMTEAMSQLGMKDRTLWNNYVNWTTHTFGNEVFKTEINNLRTFQRMPGVTVKYDTGEAGVPRFSVDFQEDRMAGARPAGNTGPANPHVINPAARSQIEASVERLNRGLASTANVIREDGGDVEGYLLNTLQGLNVDFLGRGIGGNEIQGLPSDFREAIINSRRPPTPAPRPAAASKRQRNPAQAQ